MTIKKTNSEKNGGDCEHEELIVSNHEMYLSSSNARLNHKWNYDLDTENFLLHLPKVNNGVLE